MLLLRLVGVLLLRLAERKLFGLLPQLPPRITRLELTYYRAHFCDNKFFISCRVFA